MRLLGAQVGALVCSGAKLHNEAGNAVNGDEAKVIGVADFDEGFESWGEMRFLGAEIGQLVCSGAKLHNEAGNVRQLRRGQGRWCRLL